MARYDVVLLDADMTILDFARSEEEALERVLAKWGLPRSEAVRQTYHKINSALWAALARGEVDQDYLKVERFAALLRWLDRPEISPAALGRDYELCLGESAYLLPGADDFCRALGELGVTLAIATNGLPAAQRGRYVRTGLDRLVPHLFISMELGAQKPQAAFFDRVLQKLGNPARERVVMVGDGLDTDILGANWAGIDSIWYNPAGKPLTGSARPTVTAADYGQVLAAVAG